MVTDEEVLEFFRNELSTPVNWKWKAIPLELDTHLQDYSAPDELPYAINDFGKKFGVDVSKIDMDRYCPIIKIPLLKRIIKGREIMENIVSSRPPFTIRMFAESAKAGRWLYD
ncbi:DUF1493 family protein [Serratia sp. UGAL515B_01]|uniref:DUF1493 family protein n=1 Tax=Serratia sp. UGAL515B_01 TaxID=2986763 RepID=UPI00295305F8|nr:DUF1493 family protein [Serratia sp. UGAL515B_01]WON78507.1 DUF1493 family protein [Serratia sp. UGAL515B_01]